jgi:hypothetical protein
VNERIERRLETESTPESRGYVGDGHVGWRQEAPNGVQVVIKDGPARWSTPRPDVEVPPLATLAELLEAARSEQR